MLEIIPILYIFDIQDIIKIRDILDLIKILDKLDTLDICGTPYQICVCADLVPTGQC